MDLGDINLESLGEMLASLSDDEMENITRLASDLFSGGKESAENEKKEPSGKGMPFDMDTVMKIAAVMNKLSNQPEDPGCRLLRDLKPMLSPERRNKVDKAIQMLRIVSLMPLIKELS